MRDMKEHKTYSIPMDYSDTHSAVDAVVLTSKVQVGCKPAITGKSRYTQLLLNTSRYSRMQMNTPHYYVSIHTDTYRYIPIRI